MIKAMTAAMARLNKIWDVRNVTFCIKFRFYISFVVPIMLPGYETGTLFAELERQIQGIQMKFFRRLLRMS